MDGSRIVRRPPFGTNPLVGERGTDTQRRILSAALEVFAEAGFSETGVELITTRAGCSRPAFYQYFSSKDDVFWQLAGQLGHEMVELGRRLGSVSPDADGIAALRTWIDEFTILYEAYAPVFSQFQAASRDHQNLARSSSSVSTQLGKAMLRAFGVNPRPAKNAALGAGVLAVLIRSTFYRLTLAEGLGRDRLVDGLAQIVHRLFAGPIEGVNCVPRPSGSPLPRLTDPSPAHSAGDDRDLRPRGARTRQRLLDAGAKVLPARGYQAARVDDIVEAAGVSHGSFYRYFENKEAFFRALASDAISPIIELLDRFPTASDAAAMRSWLEEWFFTYDRNGGIISTWQEMQNDDPEFMSFSQEVAGAVMSRLAPALEARGFGDALVDTLVLLAVLERLPYSVFTLEFSDRDAAIDAAVSIIRRGFMGLRT